MVLFVDEIENLEWIAGRGGDGSVSWIRAKRLPKGGPGGGNGGDGGCICVRASPHLHSLHFFSDKPSLRAENGRKGGSNGCRGPSGGDLILEVPFGTLVWDQDSGERLGDVMSSACPIVICKGGRGGKGNLVFRSSSNQTPWSKTEGAPGEVRKIRLELRSIADVGCIGLPNAGKSTLFSALTGLPVRIGDYPFTTLIPNLGVLSTPFGPWTLADIPGLIEGAHLGKGLGIRFLRHISRVKALLFVLELKEELSEMKKDFELLLGQLKEYDSSLLQKEMFLVLNKVDCFEGDRGAVVSFFRSNVCFRCALVLSGRTGEGISELRRCLESFLFTPGCTSLQ
ncbi:GTPase ObgE [Candidatus Similichlamydia laticola]|uniref:GTPase Obg n=1 Tax=Candidatus Similichlamydia laticola TaxID=2170265 RepID=A0A369KIX5_9BACT|nr:GTPase ObgE [Candidatus Similichlamydia laticola]RDB31733.1 GTP-binding protein Obg [Candidatus Similichlamydia laticola]